ncbi:MAG: cyclase family protein [Xanthobacteraceae bacterium]|nr:cyclase family protein [Xanthobacteraceae bacterium]QYK43872.1 MAG: cyclase family protein [Xanthobacteraceae bacterium]
MDERKRSGNKLDVDVWLSLTNGARMIALDHPLQKGIPIYPTHPPFHITLNNRHGDIHRGCGFSSSNELIITSTHTSTHIDALSHVSENGMLHGGVDAAKAQQGTELFREHGVETIAPIFRRGALLDVARVKNVEALGPAEEITAANLEAAFKAANISINPGDVILLRTGWTKHWSDSRKYLGLDSAGTPGVAAEGAEWLAAKKPFAVGNDTAAFEQIVQTNITMDAHRILIAQHGIHIIENLDLEELAACGRADFAFVTLPLRIKGATGSPLRPVALV